MSEPGTDPFAEPDQYAVMGNPISHSKSPQIHQQFAEQTGQNLRYSAILVAEQGFERAVRAFKTLGGRGLNVTIPFKIEAWESVDGLSDRAELAGAVNTITIMSDGSMLGDNTDGVGLVRDLVENHQLPLADQSVLLLGAGGAARGVIGPILDQEPAELCIANRTLSRAEALAELFSASGKVRTCGFTELPGQHFDRVINATATSLLRKVPPLPVDLLNDEGCCYDLMYGKQPTAFVRWGERHGAVKSLDGLGMLVEQAAESFALWRGVRPQTGPVINTLRAEMAGSPTS